ncbi:hypothetical protein EOM39_05220 [Candidatus Gracilibacteria bacterium]|nr:hypothetical protein [Candidatus Gracilibacteria bacterium]
MLSPNFFGYENEIKKDIENKGATVLWYDERPKNDFFTKVFIRLNLKVLIKKKIYEYYNNIIEQTKNTKLDYLFLVAPETINEELITKIKSLHPNLEIYIYMWDSVKNKKNGFALLSIADKFFTFDPSDIKINQKIQFLPLFYIDDYKNLSINTTNKKYDISFVGTVHSDRYPIVKRLEEDFKVFHYFYSPSKLLFKLQRLLKSSFKNIDPSDIHFESFNKDDLLKLINESKAVIDIEHPDQKGLTMRTIEMLGARKKFITTNSNIREYDFFNEANILVIDRKNPVIAKSFLELPYVDLDNSIYEKYSLSNWTKHIFQ